VTKGVMGWVTLGYPGGEAWLEQANLAELLST